MEGIFKYLFLTRCEFLGRKDIAFQVKCPYILNDRYKSSSVCRDICTDTYSHCNGKWETAELYILLPITCHRVSGVIAIWRRCSCDGWRLGRSRAWLLYNIRTYIYTLIRYVTGIFVQYTKWLKWKRQLYWGTVYCISSDCTAAVASFFVVWENSRKWSVKRKSHFPSVRQKTRCMW